MSYIHHGRCVAVFVTHTAGRPRLRSYPVGFALATQNKKYTSVHLPKSSVAFAQTRSGDCQGMTTNN
jgi:hypothetical protein